MHRLHCFLCLQAGAGRTTNFTQNNLLFVTSVLLSSSSYDLRLSTSDNVISLSVFLINVIPLFVFLRVHRV